MWMIAAAMIAMGGASIGFTIGAVIERFVFNPKEHYMASANNAALSAAVSDALALVAQLQAQIAAGHPDSAALADEVAAEDTLTAQIRAVVPEPAPEPAPAEPAA
jgi:hypothetical protein